MEKFTIINCYTKKYENDATLLRKSLKKFNLKTSHIQEYKDSGDWNINLKQKPKFIKEKLQELQSPVVWTDADSVLLQYPALLNTLNCDIAIWRDWKNKISTGTIYFNNTKGGLYVLDEWINRYNNKKCDGKNLIRTLNEITPSFMKKSTQKNTVNINRLPHTYCYWHIDNDLYEKLCNNEEIQDLKELNIVFAHTRGYNRYFKSKGLR